MTNPEPRDSAMAAVTHAYRVLAQPDFLWAPIVLAAITSLPLAVLPGMPEAPTQFATQADLDAFVRDFLPVVVVSTLLGTILGSIAEAVTYRVGGQYAAREAPRPFAPGIADLAWRFLLQTLAILLAIVAIIVLSVGVFLVVQAMIGANLALVVVGLGAIIIFVVMLVRLAIAPALLLTGAGPISAIQGSWRQTDGRFGLVLRWMAVAFLTVGLPLSIVSSAVGGMLGGMDLAWLGPTVATAVVAPFSVVYAIVFVRLARVLSSSGSTEPPPPITDVGDDPITPSERRPA